ncbi:MAG: GH116 family glycosyl hydrolase [Bacteroidales bacterium]|nr:GH116 family glycosyl hydrolase [Bacteroidales bacterium]
MKIQNLTGIIHDRLPFIQAMVNRKLWLIPVFILWLNPITAQSVKGKDMHMHSIPLTSKKSSKAGQAPKPIIAFLSQLPYDQSDIRIKSAFDQLKDFHQDSAVFLTFKQVEKQPKKLSRYFALWIHRPDTTLFTPDESNADLNLALKKYVENGGKLFLTQQAVHYLNILGYEPVPLKDSTKSCIDEGNGRKLGFHAFLYHPLFDGLNGGAYVNRPVVDITTRVAGFFGHDVPQEGQVIAVDWDYIFLREESKLVLEYLPGKGQVLAVGGYLDYISPNLNREHLNLFTKNCLDYLAGRKEDQKKYYWDYSPNTVLSYPPRLENEPWLEPVSYVVNWKGTAGELTMNNRFGSGNFWDVAGERLLTMGSEKSGIEEVWAHPFMAFRDYEAGIRFADRDTICWLADEQPEISVDPACFTRLYQFNGASLKEVIVNDPVDPDGVIHYEYRGFYPAELVIRFKSNLRWMWPYSEHVTGSVFHSWNAEMGAITFQDKTGNLNVIIGGTKKPVFHLSGQFEGFTWSKADSAFHGIPTEKFQASGLLQYHLEMNDNLDMVYTATSEGNSTTYEQYGKAIHHPEQIFERAIKHADEVLGKSLVITSPDKNFNTGYKWALLATDRFFVNTPGMGKALVAGYATTRKGWDGEHKVNGRPGYAWYFGRDASWSCYALLDYGDFSKVRSQLQFFNKYQDFSGKIFHEASTSGFIHYDAADATPLYIVLAGKYFRHTNDTAFLRETWPNIKKAINFCFSTDTDHDHLIENTNVGHGWVEGGELYGSHATFYMNGTWGAALTEAANMASFMKDIEAESYRLEVRELRKIIDRDFWDNNSRFFAYGMNKDGSFRREPTVLPAVPMYFRMTDRNKARISMQQYAGNAFSTNWGVRIVREDSPLFKPTGYHFGSVWPLFTGWASLAEYNNGNFIQGYSHLMNNLNVYRSWGLGFVEEVLNGAEYKPSGVCPHQCWSETMVLQPAIEGLLGLEVNAGEQKITLAPHLPAEWDSLSVHNIRMGQQLLDFRFSRTGGIYNYDFLPDQGKPVTIEFMPSFPAGTQVSRVNLDGRDFPYTTFTEDATVVLYVKIVTGIPSQLIVETEGGISVLPVVPDPKPGASAEGLRITGARLAGNQYMIEVEGRSGTSGIIEVYSASTPEIAENAYPLDHSGKIYRYSVDFEKAEQKYITKKVILKVLK